MQPDVIWFHWLAKPLLKNVLFGCLIYGLACIGTPLLLPGRLLLATPCLSGDRAPTSTVAAEAPVPLPVANRHWILAGA